MQLADDLTSRFLIRKYVIHLTLKLPMGQRPRSEEKPVRNPLVNPYLHIPIGLVLMAGAAERRRIPMWNPVMGRHLIIRDGGPTSTDPSATRSDHERRPRALNVLRSAAESRRCDAFFSGLDSRMADIH